MKIKNAVFSVFIFFLFTASSFGQMVSVSGTITNTGGVAIPLTIRVANVTGTYNTDSSGAYTATVQVVPIQGVAHVQFVDCNGILQEDSTFYYPGNTSVIIQSMSFCNSPVNNLVNYSGTVNNTNGGDTVTIISNGQQVSTSTTDALGNYNGSFNTNDTSGTVTAAIADCNGAIVSTSSIFSSPSFNVNFSPMDYCPQPSCKSNFTADQQMITINGQTIPVSGTVVITNTSIGNNLTYNWGFGDGATGTGLPMSHNYSGNGPYNLCLTVSDSAGICTDVFCDTLKVDSNGLIYKRKQGFTITTNPSPVGLQELNSQEQIRIYPNPASSIINIESLNLRNQLTDVKIYHGLGKMVFEQTEITQVNELLIDISDWPPGIYVTQFPTETGFVRQKLIVK